MKTYKFKVWANITWLCYSIKAVNKQSAFHKLQRKLIKKTWFEFGLDKDTINPRFNIRTIDIQSIY